MSILYKREPLPNFLTLLVIVSIEGKVSMKSVPRYDSLLIFEFTASPRGKFKSIITLLWGCPRFLPGHEWGNVKVVQGRFPKWAMYSPKLNFFL